MISDAELTALYGNGLHPDTAARLIDDLRAARAERDVLASKAVRIFERSAEPDPLLDENRVLRARLAEVEAERDWMVAERATQFEEVAQSRARLAAVEAERDAKHERILEISRLSLGFEGRLAAVRALCDADNPYLGHQECLLVADARAVLAAVDGPQPAPPAEGSQEGCFSCGGELGELCVSKGGWRFCSAKCASYWRRAAVDPPADHIAIFDGPPMRAAVDGPAEDCTCEDSCGGPNRCWCNPSCSVCRVDDPRPAPAADGHAFRDWPPCCRAPKWRHEQRAEPPAEMPDDLLPPTHPRGQHGLR